jgi:RNA polymerase sigma-70 factor, ECF subfamily
MGDTKQVLVDETDEVLVQRARTEPAAFGVLYERHLSSIYGYVYRRTGNTAEAEDLTAKVFYRALDHLDRYEPRGVPFTAWLFRIAHNLVVNWYRDNQRRRTIALDIAEPMLESSPEEPNRIAEEKEERTLLMTAVRRLSDDRQRLLVLKFASDLSNAEIGAIMGRSEGAIKALLHRTMESLRRMLSDVDRAQVSARESTGWLRSLARLRPETPSQEKQ